MAIKELIKRCQDRWSKQKQIKLPDVELISKERLYTPPSGDRITKKVGLNELTW
jgi:hypothetical protein